MRATPSEKWKDSNSELAVFPILVVDCWHEVGSSRDSGELAGVRTREVEQIRLSGGGHFRQRNWRWTETEACAVCRAPLALLLIPPQALDNSGLTEPVFSLGKWRSCT
jgi:hypothetical protein